jgi:hypothetical protein
MPLGEDRDVARNPRLRDAYLKVLNEIERSRGAIKFLNELQSTQAWKEFEHELRSDDYIRLHLGKYIVTEGIPPSELTTDQIGRNLLRQKPFFSRELIDNPARAYQDFEDALHCNEVILRNVVPIYGVKPQFEEVRLDDSARLRRVHTDEHELLEISTRSIVVLKLPPFVLFESYWKQKISITTQVERDAAWTPEIEKAIVRRLVYTLRLLGLRDFQIPVRLVDSKALGIGLGFNEIMENPLHRLHSYVELPVDFPRRLQELWHLTKETLSDDMPRWVRTTLRRLHMACLRDDPEDALIDLVIALEALLQYGESQETAYRLRMRAAVLMSLGERDEQISDRVSFGESTVRMAYKARSKVVHGTRTGYSVVELEDLNKRLFKLIRCAFMKVLALGILDQTKLLRDLVDEAMKSPLKRDQIERLLSDSPLFELARFSSL